MCCEWDQAGGPESGGPAGWMQVGSRLSICPACERRVTWVCRGRVSIEQKPRLTPKGGGHQSVVLVRLVKLGDGDSTSREDPGEEPPKSNI